MQILPILALTLGGHACFGHTTDPIVAEVKAEQIRHETAERILAERQVLAALHARADALSKSNALRLMMVLPTRIAPASLRYFIDSYPPMPIAHVFVPLMGLAKLERALGAKYGVDVALVQTEVDHLLALARLGLDEPKAAEIRQVNAHFRPVLGGGFAEELLRTLATLEVESLDSNVKLPPLFRHLAVHLVRGMELARRLVRNEANTHEVQRWLDLPPLKIPKPRPDRSLDDVGLFESPVLLDQISRDFDAASCAVSLVESARKAE